MVISYNKTSNRKDRQLTTRGPRDIQRKQQFDNVDLIEELRTQISTLQDKLLEKNKNINELTTDQINEEIAKAIKEETNNLRTELDETKRFLDESKKHVDLLKVNLNDTTLKAKLLEKDIEVLNSQLIEKDKLINELKLGDNNVTTLLTDAIKKIEVFSLSQPMENIVETSSDRPKMETVFVDPTEKGGTVDGKLSVVEENSTIKGKDVNDKVNKLKNLLGKLPDKG